MVHVWCGGFALLKHLFAENMKKKNTNRKKSEEKMTWQRAIIHHDLDDAQLFFSHEMPHTIFGWSAHNGRGK